MATTRTLSAEPQVLGVVLLALTASLRNLNLLTAEDVQQWTAGVHYNAWYPFAKQQQLCERITAQYALPDPILEKMGMEFMQTVQGFPDWRYLFETGWDFLQATQDSAMYHAFVRGHPRDIGAVSLVSLHAAEGRAVLHSTTPFSKALERGIFLRGLQLTGSFDYVDVDNAQDEQQYHIEFFTAARQPAPALSTLTAQDFLAARPPMPDRHLGGAELQKVFWRYKALAQELARQQALQAASNDMLAWVFTQLRAREVGAVVDLSARWRAEEEIARQREALHQSEKLTALGSLLAGVAHELNNPLSIVVGRAIMLEEEAPDTPTAAAVGKIRQAAERCTRIVKTFLAMARQQQPERAPVNLNTLIIAALELVGYGLRTAGIEVSRDLAPDLPDLSADAVQFNQVFTNLFVNAQQALLETPEPRRLHIATCYNHDDNWLRVTIADNGPGVPESIRSRIFDPFFTTKAVGAGTGVGLSLSHGIVAAHGGTLTLQSPPEGGACFVVTLPLVTAESPQAMDTPRPEERAESCAILVVEDEPDLAELLSRILTRAGHHTAVAHSGNEAMALLAAHDYEVILSDLHMPDLNGPDFYRQLQASHPHMLARVAFITGDTLGDVARRFLAEADRPYLEKPVSPAEVRRLVRQILSAASPEA